MPATTLVREVMTREVITLSPSDTIAVAARTLGDKGIGAAPVIDPEGRLVGLLREDDLIVSESKLHVPTVISFLDLEFVLPKEKRRFEEELRRMVGATVGEVMTTEFRTVSPTDSIEDLATEMHDSDLSHVPVLEGDRLVGIVARGDIVRFLARTL